jgi:hypothetical protein
MNKTQEVNGLKLLTESAHEQCNVMAEGYCASKGGVQEKQGVVNQFAGPENERVLGAKLIKCDVSDSALVAEEGGGGGGVGSKGNAGNRRGNGAGWGSTALQNRRRRRI